MSAPSSNRRRLVVNADDLGLTVGVNDAIFDAHAFGILTSASLFANAPETDDAIRRARLLPSLGLGVHLTLVDGEPTLPARLVPSLVDRDGRFRPSWKPFIVDCVRRRVSLVEVERELTAQIERLVAAGVALTHLDAHKHVHAYPPVFAIVARLAVGFGIPVVRNPFERVKPWRVSGAVARRQAWLNAAMWPWARRNASIAAAAGVRTPQFVGRIHTGVLDAASLGSTIRALEPGITELMVHPGYVDDALQHSHTRLIESRQQELMLLTSADVRAQLASRGVELVRHDLAHALRRVFRHVS
jgi:hopanoid biosynthesis associated protein HpnK